MIKNCSICRSVMYDAICDYCLDFNIQQRMKRNSPSEKCKVCKFKCGKGEGFCQICLELIPEFQERNNRFPNKEDIMAMVKSKC